MAEYSTALREQFAAIGRTLQEKREAQGLTVQNISTFTRINSQTLRAIENGDLDHLPALIFVKGFIRNYMEALSIEDSSLHEDLAALDRLKVQGNEGAPLLGYSSVLDRGETQVPWGRVALALVAILLMGWVVYLVVEVSSSDQEEQVHEQSAPAAPSGSTVAPALQPAAPAPAPSASAPVTASQSPPPPIRETLRLTVQGLERTWIRVAVDNGRPIDVLLEPADSLSWEARGEFRLTVGKSQGVRVTLEGEEFTLPNEPNTLLPEMVLNRETLLLLQN